MKVPVLTEVTRGTQKNYEWTDYTPVHVDFAAPVRLSLSGTAVRMVVTALEANKINYGENSRFYTDPLNSLPEIFKGRDPMGAVPKSGMAVTELNPSSIDEQVETLGSLARQAAWIMFERNKSASIPTNTPEQQVGNLAASELVLVLPQALGMVSFKDKPIVYDPVASRRGSGLQPTLQLLSQI